MGESTVVNHRCLKVRAPGHALSDDVLSDELESRQHYAARLFCVSKQYPIQVADVCDESTDTHYCFEDIINKD